MNKRASLVWLLALLLVLGPVRLAGANGAPHDAALGAETHAHSCCGDIEKSAADEASQTVSCADGQHHCSGCTAIPAPNAAGSWRGGNAVAPETVTVFAPHYPDLVPPPPRRLPR